LRVTYHEAARSELAEAVRFYEEHSRGLGTALAEEVRAAVERVESHPDIGIAVRPGVRRLLLTRFPYSILYHISASGESLRILAVMHHRRHPSSWRDRD
jgi:plasmid stabilization system protein ParE